MATTKGIVSIAYPEIQKKLAANIGSYRTYISDFINSRHQDLYANAPLHQIYFSANDTSKFFNATKIEVDVITKAIQNTFYYKIANFNPRCAKDETTIAMLCIVKYFKDKGMKKELDLSLINLAFSGKIYTSIFHGSFPVTEPQENVMQYVITNKCSNKFDIIKEGSLIGAIKSIATTWVNAYPDKFKRFDDDDVKYLIQQLHNRIRSFMNNIAELYYEAYENKEYLTYDSDDVSEDNYHLADSDSFKMHRAVAATMSAINNHGVDQRICKMASNENVKVDELKSIIENLLADTNNSKLIEELITLTIVCFYMDPVNKGKNVTDLSFVSYTIKPKPNAKNKYIVRQKEIITIMLVNNSEHFMRRKSRAATEQAYYKAMNAYFAILIQNANK